MLKPCATKTIQLLSVLEDTFFFTFFMTLLFFE